LKTVLKYSPNQYPGTSKLYVTVLVEHKEPKELLLCVGYDTF